MMTLRIRVVLGLALLSVGLVVAQPVSISQWTKLYWLCIGDLEIIPKLVEIGPIPVGCEVIDCCPGCPGPPDFLEWRIKVTGDPVEGVELVFENLPPDAARQLTLRGDARWTDGGRLRVGRGETIIGRLPGNVKDRPPVALLRLAPDKGWIRKHRAAAHQATLKTPAGSDQGDAGTVEIRLEQLLGPVIVNEVAFRYVLKWCWPPPPRSDVVDLNNNGSNDQAVVLLDARRASGCVDDEVWRGNNIIGVGSVVANGSCRSEAVVLSDDDAMRLVPNVNVWTNSLGDRLPVDQTPDLLQAPVAVWVAMANTVARAQADIANGNLLYNTNNGGIGFNAAFQDVSGNATAVTTIGLGCANAAGVQGSAFFTANRLNVYYVNSAFTGVNCGINRNIQYMGTTSNNQSLAHEFGHAFSLGHTNGLAGFPAANVMIGGGAARTHFSDGQAFRMNAHCTSVLNTDGVRAATLRDCPNTLANCGGGVDTHCPALALDVTPK